MNTKTRWILELDYDADPEEHREDVIDDVFDEIEGLASRARFLDDTRLLFSDSDAAMRFKLRFGQHLVAVERLG